MQTDTVIIISMPICRKFALRTLIIVRQHSENFHKYTKRLIHGNQTSVELTVSSN